MKKKGALQISFAWIFALIVGVFILFLAIYAVTKFIGNEQEISDAEIAKQITVLINPLETGFESGKVTSLILPVETRIYNRCDSIGSFGTQSIKIAQKSFGKWTDTNTDIESLNKYIFSEEYAEGKKLYLFSKPFEFPFKVSDLIYLTSSEKEYCFVNPPKDVKDELSELNQENLIFECSSNSIKICFEEKTGCDIIVNKNAKYVEKDNTKIYFEGDALMYAGIFSDKDIYECQVKRLMQKVGNLVDIYQEKEILVSGICDAELYEELSQLKSLVVELNNSDEIYKINNLAEDIQNKNERGTCALW
ncbi:MAG: hypothetical protein Q8P15_01195 [Nanoarchaeota archaeon]|nr:hypothetical protein [Nanoarchaeota archaeon]